MDAHKLHDVYSEYDNQQKNSRHEFVFFHKIFDLCKILSDFVSFLEKCIFQALQANVTSRIMFFFSNLLLLNLHINRTTAKKHHFGLINKERLILLVIQLKKTKFFVLCMCFGECVCVCLYA